MQVRSHGMTDRGMVRPFNEDAYFMDDAHRVYAVADGLGGLPGGADTSQRIVALLAKSMRHIDADEERFDLAELILGINQIISKEGLDAHPFTGTGSTLTLCQIVADQLLIGHVGDSALYLHRAGTLEKLTIDHTLEQELIDQHGAAAREHMPTEYPHTLTRCVGQEGELRVDQNRVTLLPGDQILLCTDGLNKVVEESQINQVLSSDNDLESICRALTQKAHEQEGPDNITLITLRCG
ncbi:MAG: PP2C family protein-serine/threonine phosphatase [Opitutales bacterium]